MTEYLLTTNNYLEPSSISGADAYGTLLVRLLLLDPGTNPLHPNMGVGIGSRYRFMTEDKLSVLEAKIHDQVMTYCPPEFSNDVIVSLEVTDSKYLSIIIEADGTKYVYETEKSDTPIELSSIY